MTYSDQLRDALAALSPEQQAERRRFLAASRMRESELRCVAYGQPEPLTDGDTDDQESRS